MTKYVLEILDGDQAGETLALGEGRITIGRRADNDLSIKDEKCSGQHAEIACEDGRFVVKDLGSTNGTILDGRKIEEVALSPFDIVQFGRVRVQFKQAGLDGSVDDLLQVARVDQQALLRSRRKRGSLVVTLLVVVIVAGGLAAAWFTFFAAEQGKGPTARGPLKVAGNLLRDGADDFEQDGAWNLQAAPSGAAFDVVVSRALAHSGTSAIAARAAPSEGAKAQRFALARLREPLHVGSDAPVALRGWLATTGTGRVALRLSFSSSTADDGAVLRTGTAPASYVDYQAVELLARVPVGMDRVEVEILAILPDDEAEVFADDVSVRADRTLDVPGLVLDSGRGHKLTGVGGSFRVSAATEPTLLGVEPLVEDPILQELDAAGELSPTDAGLTLVALGIPHAGSADGLKGFRIDYQGGDGLLSRGLSIDFPPAAASVLTRGGDGAPFVPHPAEFEATGVAELLLGTAEGRCLLRFAPPVAARGKLSTGSYRIELPGTHAFDLQVVFADEASAARELRRSAESARREGRAADALDAVVKILEQSPHDVAVVREAQTLRSEILADVDRRVAELQEEASAARFFDSLDGYRAVHHGIDELISTYGEHHVRQLDGLRQIAAEMAAGQTVLEDRAAVEHARMLQQLAEAFDAADQKKLSDAVSAYVQRGGK